MLTPFPPSKNRPRPGDWTCPSCGFSNFQRRTVCFRCSFPAMSAQQPDPYGQQYGMAPNPYGGAGGYGQPHMMGGPQMPGGAYGGMGGGQGGQRTSARTPSVELQLTGLLQVEVALSHSVLVIGSADVMDASITTSPRTATACVVVPHVRKLRWSLKGEVETTITDTDTAVQLALPTARLGTCRCKDLWEVAHTAA